MANSFTPEQLKELRECFDLFDADNSGSIDKNEIKNILKSLEITVGEDEFDEVFARIDADNSGSIEWEEFLDVMSKEYYKPFTMKQIKDCFRRYDLNGDGTVSLNELRIVLEKCGRQMTQKQIEDLAKSLDRDDNGNISLEEFAKLLE